MKSKIAIFSILYFNFFPLYGVLRFGWDPSAVIFLYWYENLVVGLFTVFKMWLAQKPNLRGVSVMHRGEMVHRTDNVSIIKGFILLYGIILTLFAYILFDTLEFTLILDQYLVTSIGAISLGYAVSVMFSYIHTKEYERVAAEDLFGPPLFRLMLILIAALLGSSAHITFNGRVIGLLPGLLFFKTLIDIIVYKLQVKTKTILGTKIKSYHIDDALIKKIWPNYEQVLVNRYKKSVETGKWAETKKDMDPEVAKYVEDFYRQHHGINPDSIQTSIHPSTPND